MHSGFSGFPAVLLVLLVRSVRWFGGIVMSGCASRSLLGSYVHQELILMMYIIQMCSVVSESKSFYFVSVAVLNSVLQKQYW